MKTSASWLAVMLFSVSFVASLSAAQAQKQDGKPTPRQFGNLGGTKDGSKSAPRRKLPLPAAAAHLRPVEIIGLRPQMDPCITTNGVQVTLEVDPKGLPELHGKFRDAPVMQANQDAAQKDRGKAQTAYVTELVLEFRDSQGRSLHKVVTDHPLPADGMEVLRVPLAASWNGVPTATDGQAASGSVTANAQVNLVRLQVQGASVREELLETLEFADTGEVVPAIARCREWVRLAPSLASTPDGTFKVHGYDSGERPSITWRGQRPYSIWGEMAQAGTGQSRGMVARDFIAREQKLFGIGSPHILQTLQASAERADYKGGHRVLLRQFLSDKNRGPRGNLQVVRLRAPKGRLVAVFDAADKLIALQGQLLEDLPARLTVARYPRAQAEAAVRQDLQAKGFSAGRTVTFQEQIVFGKRAAEYQRAYVFGVGRASKQDEGADRRGQTFRYTVSAETKSILRIEDRTYHGISVQAPIWKFNEQDQSNAPSSADLANDADPGSCPLTAPHAQPPLYANTSLQRMDVDNHENSRADFHFRNITSPTGIIEEVSDDTTGDEFSFPSRAYFFSFTTPASERAGTAYFQAQQFWDAIPGFFLWDDPDRLSIVVDSDETGVCFPGAYSGNKIRLYRDFPHDLLFAPTHETFHHFDSVTADLDNDTPMSFAIKEGVADFMMQAMSPYTPDNKMAVGARALVCALSLNFRRSCIQPDSGPFRSLRIVPFPGHRPLKAGDTDLAAWPDCRIPDGRNIHCLFVQPPGSGGNFPWDVNGSPLYIRGLIPQSLHDAWESGADVAPSADFQQQFPLLVADAFTDLDDEPTFPDFKRALMLEAITLHIVLDAQGFRARDAVPLAVRAQISQALDRHGIDDTLDQFCAANEGDCH